jgi:hypothetical protein
MTKESINKTLSKQIKLQDELDHNADIGYLPPADKVKKLREYQKETGIIIRNPDKEGKISGECPPGYIFVASHKKSDGTIVRAFCRKRGTFTVIPEKYAYRRR